MKIYFRHKSIRKYQKEMMEDIVTSLEEKKNIMCHAPMGIGKTDASISAALSYALENDLSLLFLTPKISQHKIAMEVLFDLKKRFELPYRMVDVVGRKYMCSDKYLSETDYEDFYQVCERRRKNETCMFFANAKGFSKKQQGKAKETYERIKKNCKRFSHEEIKELSVEEEACSYEIALRMAGESQVIVADYFQLLLPSIRTIFINRINKDLEKTIVILDEAHNISARMRESLSRTLNGFLFKRAAKEAQLIGEKEDEKKLLRLERDFEKWIVRFENETLVAKIDFIEYIKEGEEIDFAEISSRYIESTGKKSACARLGRFYEEVGGGDEGFVYLVRENTLKRKCLDPSGATSILNSTHSSILMSGTLTPMEMHRDVLGLERTVMKEYSSPFPKHNRLNIIVPTATTRYSKREEGEYRKIAGIINNVAQEVPGNMGIFFPSYGVMGGVEKYIKGNKLFQNAGMKPSEISDLMLRFQNSEKSMLIAVQGGSLAEGYDYPNGIMKGAIMVGIALDEMSLEVQALIDYYEGKFGKGWEYGYLFPAVVRALQASGRMIRSEEDRGIAVFLDERFKWKNYTRCFPRDFEYVITHEPEKITRMFWEEKGK